MLCIQYGCRGHCRGDHHSLGATASITVGTTSRSLCLPPLKGQSPSSSLYKNLSFRLRRIHKKKKTISPSFPITLIGIRASETCHPTHVQTLPVSPSVLCEWGGLFHASGAPVRECSSPQDYSSSFFTGFGYLSRSPSVLGYLSFFSLLLPLFPRSCQGHLRLLLLLLLPNVAQGW